VCQKVKDTSSHIFQCSKTRKLLPEPRALIYRELDPTGVIQRMVEQRKEHLLRALIRTRPTLDRKSALTVLKTAFDRDQDPFTTALGTNMAHENDTEEIVEGYLWPQWFDPRVGDNASTQIFNELKDCASLKSSKESGSLGILPNETELIIKTIIRKEANESPTEQMSRKDVNKEVRRRTKAAQQAIIQYALSIIRTWEAHRNMERRRTEKSNPFAKKTLAKRRNRAKRPDQELTPEQLSIIQRKQLEKNARQRNSKRGFKPNIGRWTVSNPKW